MDAVIAASSAVEGSSAGPLRELAAHLERHEGCAEVLASLQAGHGGTLGGVWGSACALVAATVSRACSCQQQPGTLVVVLPHAGDIDDFCDDLNLFTDVNVTRLPAWESDAGERVLHDEIYGQRLRVLKRFKQLDPNRVLRCSTPIPTTNHQSPTTDRKSVV